MSNAFAFRRLARSAPAAIALVALAFSSGTAGGQVARADGTTALAAGQALLGAPPFERTLTLEDRFQAQRAIEEVYWRHRVWPKENRTPKPPLSAVVSDAAIRAKVEDYLRKSNALATWWQRPVTGVQLQAEMNRMARSTREPEMLRELFAALNNDALLIAETLARPALVDRLIHNWYSTDDRFHGVLRQEAERALGSGRNVTEMRALGGEYVERTMVRSRTRGEAHPERRHQSAVELDDDRWKQFTRELARPFGSAQDAIPVGRLSALQEDADRFLVTAVLSLEDDEAVVASVVWPKRSFDSWWSVERKGTSPRAEAESSPYTLPAPAEGACTDDTWEQTRWVRFPVIARAGHTAVWTGSEMIVWGGSGGWTEPGVSNTGGRYDPATDTLTPTSTGASVPSARSGHTAVWTGTEMIVWGGHPNGLSNTGGRYDPATDSWTPTSTGTNVPSARELHTAVWTGTEMIVWGGHGYDGTFKHLDTGGRYDPAADTWIPTSTGANVPSARQLHTAVWTGTEMIVWGGWTEAGVNNTGGRYDPATDTWTPTATGANVPSARINHTAVWTGSEMIVWGGYRHDTWQDHYLDTGGRYDPATDTWTPTSTGANVPSAREIHTAVWTGSEMIVWGGSGYDGYDDYVSNTGGRYDPATDAWTPTSTGALHVPSARSNHTAVWTGTEMIVWGGSWYDGTYHYLDTGGRYDPATDNWTPTATGANVPSARAGHTAVWTGTEMIVWGGHQYGFTDHYLDTGGRYDPATDTWTPTSTGTNVPSGRDSHTAVWTGSEMIVWGGYWVDDSQDTYYVDTGGRYDPATDTWAPTSTGANVPSARDRHTAVWTGSEMIVWGGFEYVGTFNDLDTGGRYDPATDTWTPTSTGANVPSARFWHTAAWTGSEMIVWGGGWYDGTFHYLDTGGRYDPATDNWTPTATGANVPSAREWHTAVWTGTEAIVWGGHGYDGSFVHRLDTGGRYDPAADAWTPTSTGANVPFARDGHTAVWTGTEMIVWGGASYLGLLDTGGRYCAFSCPFPTTSYRDDDGDGYGNPLLSTLTCDGSVPSGYASNETDCDDSSPGIRPGAVDLPGNTIDEDCSGVATCDPSAFWSKQGDFVRCVSRECDRLVGTGLVSPAQCSALVSQAARLHVGRP